MKLKIGCTTFPVRYSSKELYDEEQQLNGYISYHPHEIRVWSKGSDPAETLMHEVIHGVLWDRGMDGLCDDESFVSSFSRGLMQVIRDNPCFLKALE